MKTYSMKLIFLILLTMPFFADATPNVLTADTRIKKVLYDANVIVPLKGITFINTQIIFNAKEKIIDVQGGDAAAWTIHIAKDLPYILNIKPTILGSHTNLSVVTINVQSQTRYYHFALSSNQTPQAKTPPTYVLQFIYPAILSTHQTIKEIRKSLLIKKPTINNLNYSFSGVKNLLPQRVWDDGQFTYIQFYPNQSLPAIFVVNNAKGQEAVINYRATANHTVILQRIAPQWTLREGANVASIFNHALISHYQ